MKSNSAKIIIALRKERDMNQQELADMLFVSRSLVAMWETGKRIPDGASVEKMAGFFGVSESDIVSDRRYAYGLPSELDMIEKEIEEFTEDEPQDGAGNNGASLRGFLASLKDSDRTIFMGRYYSMKTCKAIAADMKMKEVTVRGRLARLRNELKAFFNKEN
ncbi:MAG: helix-turn-helix domain-containing protein [Clostridia bacterium]|nr:helix-turn-helix domain-containing protein [Clostridia bacterium]